MDTINKIIKLLDEKNLNQKALTDFLGIDKSTFSAWKSGKNQSYKKYLYEISKFLDVSVDYLIGNSIEIDFLPHENDEYLIKCPYCDYDYVHYDGFADVNFSTAKSSGIALKFFCEAGHKFYVIVETYKGNTYMVTTDGDYKMQNNRDLIFESSLTSLSDLWTKDDFNRICNQYASLDSYGKKAVDDLLDNEYERCQEEKKIKVIQLPLSELKVSAGIGSWIEDNRYGTIEVVDTPESRKADLVIEINGNSMEPTYHNGDNVLVRLQPSIDIGEIGVFVKGSEGYIKELGKNCLISRNKEYEDIIFNEYSDIHCVGKVIGVAEVIR